MTAQWRSGKPKDLWRKESTDAPSIIITIRPEIEVRLLAVTQSKRSICEAPTSSMARWSVWKADILGQDQSQWSLSSLQKSSKDCGPVVMDRTFHKQLKKMIKVQLWSYRSLCCAFYIPLLSWALNNMDTFYAHGEFCWSKTKCLNALPRRTICVTRRDMEISCSPAITVSLSCVFTWCVFFSALQVILGICVCMCSL